MKKRCFGIKELYVHYHDEEWGVPVYDDRTLFEMLVLEGAQAGLSWETILNKRVGYRHAFYNFDVEKVAAMSDDDREALRHDSNIVRNRLKINSACSNAHIFIKIQKEFGSFNTYLWNFVSNKPIVNQWLDITFIPVITQESDALSADLKKRGMKFVGSTIMYAYMQSVGLVNDHVIDCWKNCHEK